MFGKIVQGHVLDCNPKWLEQRLKQYDPQLYLRWNPEKNGGAGIWELRRLPSQKSLVYHGDNLFTVEYREKEVISHIADLAVLNYKLLDALYEADTWRDGEQGKHYARNLEYNEEQAQERKRQRLNQEMKYNLKQFKKEMQDFKQMVAEGQNPGRVLMRAFSGKR